MSIEQWIIVLQISLLFGFWTLAKAIEGLRQDVRGLREEVAGLRPDRD